MAAHGSLFEDAEWPDGFQYRRDFLTAEEEASLAAAIATLEFSDFELRGVVARRRVAFFGRTYSQRGITALPLPPFLVELRRTIAQWTGVAADAFAMALINEYSPGAPIGWHRDAPQYGIVAGVSLLSDCRMKFRPYVRPAVATAKPMARRIATNDLTLERRSAYLMTGASRQAYEHHIPAVSTLRYSITFRTIRS
jgi:alkylated DNA repair dioxygenase AlkB